MKSKALNAPPLYMRIHSELKKRIEAGEWNYGAMLPSEIELGEVLKISRGTVRQVLAELEKEGLVSRERGRGTFVTYMPKTEPNETYAQHSIAFIVPYVRDSFVSSILLGLEREARANGFAVIFSHFENNPEKQELALQASLAQHVAGVILYPANSNMVSNCLVEMLNQHFPLVFVDRYIRGLYVDTITSDNFGGGMIATQHLLNLGHKKIAFLKWSESATSIAHRQAGYRQALQEAGISPLFQYEWEVVGYPEVDLNALEEQLSQPNRPTAVFAANDQLAIAVQRAARALKLSIPEDLALVGFDDLDISAHLDIPLTTVAQPAFEIGRTAWYVLNHRINSPKSCPEIHFLPVQLIVRQSSGAIKSEFSTKEVVN